MLRARGDRVPVVERHPSLDRRSPASSAVWQPPGGGRGLQPDGTRCAVPPHLPPRRGGCGSSGCQPHVIPLLGLRRSPCLTILLGHLREEIPPLHPAHSVNLNLLRCEGALPEASKKRGAGSRSGPSGHAPDGLPDALRTPGVKFPGARELNGTGRRKSCAGRWITAIFSFGSGAPPPRGLRTHPTPAANAGAGPRTIGRENWLGEQRVAVPCGPAAQASMDARSAAARAAATRACRPPPHVQGPEAGMLEPEGLRTVRSRGIRERAPADLRASWSSSGSYPPAPAP